MYDLYIYTYSFFSWPANRLQSLLGVPILFLFFANKRCKLGVCCVAYRVKIGKVVPLLRCRLHLSAVSSRTTNVMLKMREPVWWCNIFTKTSSFVVTTKRLALFPCFDLYSERVIPIAEIDGSTYSEHIVGLSVARLCKYIYKCSLLSIYHTGYHLRSVARKIDFISIPDQEITYRCSWLRKTA